VVLPWTCVFEMGRAMEPPCALCADVRSVRR